MKLLMLALLTSSLTASDLYDKFPEVQTPDTSPNKRKIKIRISQQEGNEIFRRAQAGDAEAQYRLGQLYDYGGTLPSNQNKALAWYQKAAAQNHAKARDHANAILASKGKFDDIKLGDTQIPLLFRAIDDGNTEYVSSLLDRGLSTAVRNPEGYNPLEYALAGNVPNLLQICTVLVNKGADMDGYQKNGTPLFDLICRLQNPSIVCLYLEKSKKINAEKLETILSIKELANNNTVIQSLIKAGIPATGANLLRAARSKSLPIVQYILSKNGTQSIQEKGIDSLCAATSAGHILTMQALIKAGADPKHGSVILAACQATPEIVQMIVDQGGNINMKGGSQGYTPLHAACMAANCAVIEFLIRKGVDLNPTDLEGKTPLDLLHNPLYFTTETAEARRTAAVEIMKQAGAQRSGQR